MSTINTLPGLGTATYGDGDGTNAGTHYFNCTTYTKSFRITPEKDAAKRTITSLTYAITLCEWLEPITPIGGGGTDIVVQNAINVLTKPAQKLVLTNRGISPISVNTGLAGRDLKWGPFSRDITITPNSNQSVLLEWTVEFSLMPNYSGLVTQIMEFVYNMAFGLDKNGKVTRTYDGYIEIPLTRATPQSRAIPFSVDQYRTTVVPTRLIGFERTQQRFTVDESKRRLSFNVVDVQRYGNPLPAGIIDAEAKQEWQNVQQKGVASWSTTLSATYTLSPGTTANVAVQAFNVLLGQRVALMQAMKTGDGLPVGPRALGDGFLILGRPVVVVPVSYRAGETNIYGPDGQKVDISCTMWVGGVGLPAILANGGLWQPVSGANWKVWSTSVNIPQLGPFGTANMAFRIGDDNIIDLQTGISPALPP